MPRAPTKSPSSIQKASARRSVSGTSAATRSTTSRQNSTGIAASKAAVDMPCPTRVGTASPPPPGGGYQRRWMWRRASRIAAVPVAVLDADGHALVAREVGAREAVGRDRRLGQRQEPLRVLYHPARVEAHVVGHHVARQA